MFLDILGFRIERRRKIRENCFKNVVPGIQKRTSCPCNLPKILNAFNFFFFQLLLVFYFFLKVVLWTHKFFFHKSETPFSEQFSLNNLHLFSILNFRMSRNMFKLCHKVRNGQNLPNGNFRNIFDDWKSLNQIKIYFLL